MSKYKFNERPLPKCFHCDVRTEDYCTICHLCPDCRRLDSEPCAHELYSEDDEVRHSIERIDDNECRVSYTSLGEPYTFWVRAPRNGGYVRLDGEQVCDGFAPTGATLMWFPGGETMAELTLRHLRKKGSIARIEKD